MCVWSSSLLVYARCDTYLSMLSAVVLIYIHYPYAKCRVWFSIILYYIIVTMRLSFFHIVINCNASFSLLFSYNNVYTVGMRAILLFNISWCNNSIIRSQQLSYTYLYTNYIARIYVCVYIYTYAVHFAVCIFVRMLCTLQRYGHIVNQNCSA